MALSRNELVERLRLVDEAQTDDFATLVSIAKLNSRRNLKLADWSGVCFRDSDLRGFDFSGSRLHNCDFRGARIEGARFDQAELDRAGSNPATRTNLTRAKDWTAHLDAWESSPTRLADDHLPIGAVFQDAPFTPQMIIVPAGLYTRGSPPGETGRHEAEGPDEDVRFSAPFAVGRYAVTFDEWDAYVKRSHSDYSPPDEGWGRHTRPVINISWEDANRYIAWLSETTGKPYRFLTESEHEYVSRAGQATPYWWGSTISTAQANYNARPAHNHKQEGLNRARTVKVGAFKPNPWGLYQVHGNVWEWTQDIWHRDYNYTPLDGSAWTAGDTSRRVLRGGSWFHSAEYLRAASRHESTIDARGPAFGLRVARSLQL